MTSNTSMLVSISSEETTVLLERWANGCEQSLEELFSRLYPDLRDLAGRHAWAADLADCSSDLAQDLCVRLLGQRHGTWHNRGHFFAIAAKLIRRLAIDKRRHLTRLKRGGGATHLPLDALDLESVPGLDVDLIALSQCLDQLADISPSAARVVELRFFAGLSLEEVAAVLEVGQSTVSRRWTFAKAWLHTSLAGGRGSGQDSTSPTDLQETSATGERQ